MPKKEIFRVVTRAQDGSLRIRDFHSAENILATHSQVGTDDSSTDLDLRGMPVFRGLIGPIPEGKNIVRYESPEVFETLTKEWEKTISETRSSDEMIIFRPGDTIDRATGMWKFPKDS